MVRYYKVLFYSNNIESNWFLKNAINIISVNKVQNNICFDYVDLLILIVLIYNLKCIVGEFSAAGINF